MIHIYESMLEIQANKQHTRILYISLKIYINNNMQKFLLYAQRNSIELKIIEFYSNIF